MWPMIRMTQSAHKIQKLANYSKPLAQNHKLLNAFFLQICLMPSVKIYSNQNTQKRPWVFKINNGLISNS